MVSRWEAVINVSVALINVTFGTVAGTDGTLPLASPLGRKQEPGLFDISCARLRLNVSSVICFRRRLSGKVEVSDRWLEGRSGFADQVHWEDTLWGGGGLTAAALLQMR